MLKLQSRIKNCGIAFLLLGLLLCPLSSFAQGVCFDEETARRMVVTLEQAKIAEQQLTVSAGSNVELQSQVDILKGTIKLMQDQITVYQSMTDMAKQFSDTKDKLCQEQIKAATPTFMDNVKSNVLAGSIGAALAVVLMLLL